MAEQQKPRCPAGSGKAGRALWKRFMDDAEEAEVDLDAAELDHLATGVMCADRIAFMQSELDRVVAAGEGLMVKGVAGQPVAHPYVGEIRQYMALKALTLARIKIGGAEDVQLGIVTMPRGVQQRDAVNKRWRNTP